MSVASASRRPSIEAAEAHRERFERGGSPNGAAGLAPQSLPETGT